MGAMGLMQDHFPISGPEPQPNLKSPFATSDTTCPGSGDEGKESQEEEGPCATSNTSLKCDFRTCYALGQEPQEHNFTATRTADSA